MNDSSKINFISTESSMEIKPWQQMISSCTGSILTSILVTPLDVVKIRLQAQQKEFLKNKCFLYCNGLMDHICICPNGSSSTMKKNGNSPMSSSTSSSYCHIHGNSQTKSSCAYHSISCVKNLTEKQLRDLWFQRPGHFNGTFDAMVKISRSEGITSLWSGLPPTLVMAIPATVMYFTIYDQLRIRLRKHFQTSPNSKADIFVPVVAGASARFVAATLISPLEMVRTKMQSQKISYLQIWQAIVQSVRSDGILRLWAGLNVTLLRDVPFSALYWFNYENMKRLFGMNYNDYHFGFCFLAGAASGSIAATITLPFDVVKTHRQIELGQTQLANQPVESKKTLDIMAKIFRENGIRGLFAGIVPRLIKVAPACAIMISTYEAGKNFFRKYNQAQLQRLSEKNTTKKQ